MALARASAQEALRLNPSLAEAYVTLAYVEFLYDWNWGAAERDFRKAIALNPSYAPAHQWYSEYLMCMGRHDEAIEEGRRAVELDPTSPIQNQELGYKFLHARRYPEAIEQLRRSLELEPSFPETQRMLVDAYWFAGMRDRVVAEAEHLDERRKSFYRLLAQGKNAEAIELLGSFPKDEFPPVILSMYYARAGDGERALELLDEAFGQRIGELTLALVNPAFDPWRSDPRFMDLRRRMELD